VGETRTGKSTLANALIDQWARHDAAARILIVDTKPRFRAAWDLTGVRADHRYRHWRQGAYVPHSVRLPPLCSVREMRQGWDIARTITPKGRGLILVAQPPVAIEGVAGYFPWLDYLIRGHFADLNKRWWNYLYIDEMLSFMRSSRKLHAGTVQMITAGGELGHTFLGGTQRPRWIPVEAMTEVTKLFAFRMSSDEDVDHLRGMGLPGGFRLPRVRHQFHVYDKVSEFDRFLTLPESVAKSYGGQAPT
jgi:hypothetical protein